LHDILNCVQIGGKDPNDWYMGLNMRNPRTVNIHMYLHEVRDAVFSCRNSRRLIGNVTTPISDECRQYFEKLHATLRVMMDRIESVCVNDQVLKG
jgi:hypothetical protein